MHFWEHKEVNLISLAILFPLLQWRKIHNIVLQKKKNFDCLNILVLNTMDMWKQDGSPNICLNVYCNWGLHIVIEPKQYVLSLFHHRSCIGHHQLCILSFVSKCHLALAAVNMNMLISTCMYNFVRPLTIHLLFCNG